MDQTKAGHCLGDERVLREKRDIQHGKQTVGIEGFTAVVDKSGNRLSQRLKINCAFCGGTLCQNRRRDSEVIWRSRSVVVVCNGHDNTVVWECACERTGRWKHRQGVCLDHSDLVHKHALCSRPVDQDQAARAG